MFLFQFIARLSRLFDFRGTPRSNDHPLWPGMIADGGSLQHGKFLLCLHASRAEREGEFPTAPHGEDGVKQFRRWKDRDFGQSKVLGELFYGGICNDVWVALRVLGNLSRGGHSNSVSRSMCSLAFG